MALGKTPVVTQRQLASELSVSLGAVNSALTFLVEQRFVESLRVQNGVNRVAYRYELTDSGQREKTRLGLLCLKAKETHVENLEEEILSIRLELDQED